MKKVLPILLFLVLTSTKLVAQYSSVVSNFNAYRTMYNPAATGDQKCLSLTGFYKKSWVGISNSPETMFLSIHSPLKNEKIALGGIINQFTRGQISNFKILPSVSYAISSQNSELRFGAGVGLQSYSPNNNYNVNDAGDELFQNTQNTLFPQLSFGVSYSWKKWYASVSAPSVFQINSYSVDKKTEWNKELITTLAAEFIINTEFSYRISGLWEYNITNLLMVEGMLFYQEQYGLGAVYKSSKQWAINAEGKINKQFSVMYSFEVNNQMYSSTSFSHEIGLTYNFKYFVNSPGVDFF